MMGGEAASVPHMDEDAHRDWSASIKQHFGNENKKEAAAPSKLIGIGIKPVFQKR